jgi:4-hydroxythreonine-4-phosphate dehydrogenase
LSELPMIGVTLGDPTGVGPEVVAKALAHREIYEKCRPLAIGSSSALRRIIEICGLDQEVRNVERVGDAEFEFGVIDVLDLWNVDHSELPFKEPTAEGGAAAATAVIEAVKLAYSGETDGLATAPLHKVAMKMAGFDYPGHTEIVGEFSESLDPRMMLVAGKLRVIHVSTHVGLGEAVELVKTPRVLEAIIILHRALLDLGIDEPKIAVPGLNPHAEVGNLFGAEDSEEIAPAVEQAREQGINAIGPLPPDTVFARAAAGEYDGVVAMYHDQGHIPVKMLGIHEGVNITLNTNVIRASVDHGTAYGRAGEGRAEETSMRLSILVAVDMINARRIRQVEAG